jgi:hypothetical protein
MEAGRFGEDREKTFLRKEDGRTPWRLPLVGDGHWRTGQERKMLTGLAFSWKPRTSVSRSRYVKHAILSP